ncbi:hypothetical protein GCM10010094_72080 [Streptomyces flaveus]|uniref:Uncharacterized protein n=2 Tax=Streptomyces flaveus TaxID=66370 RepID=A0A917RCB9_9ACTN|nr:hypothetical protein GCM10010094_72080 [Streptomyces flaveus]
MAITSEWLDEWLKRMEALTSAFIEGFQLAFGYPPGENYVVSVSGASGAGVKEFVGVGGVPEDLVAFYRRVGKVSLPDVGSGFFVHSVGQTVAGVCGDLPTRIVGAREDSVVVFGSDGGGAFFALSATDGATVYRLPPSGVEGGVYTEGALPCEVVASDLAGFLRLLEHELKGGQGLRAS